MFRNFRSHPKPEFSKFDQNYNRHKLAPVLFLCKTTLDANQIHHVAKARKDFLFRFLKRGLRHVKKHTQT